MDYQWRMEMLLIWKIVGVAAYLLVLLGIGIAASGKMEDIGDYFAAGKDLSFWAVAFSARATGESGWLLLGLTGMGAAFGVRGFWVVLGEVLGVVGAWILLAKPFNEATRKFGSITVPDYLEDRFRDSSGAIRIVSAVALTIFVTIYVSAQIDATGKAFETFLGLDWLTGVLIGFGVVMAYSVTGGFKAVVWSDIFQGSLMFVGLVGLPIVGTIWLGGPAAVFTGLYDIDPGLLSPAGPAGWSLMTVLGTVALVLIGLGFLGSPQIFVRFLALRDPSEVPKGALVAFVWTLLADSGAVLVGIVGRVLLEKPGEAMIGKGAVLGEGGESVLPMLVEMVLPGVLVGLFIAIVLSAIMSTVDSLLVLAGSAAVRDLYQKVLNPTLPDDELVRLSRFATFGLGAVALSVALAVYFLVPGRTIFWFVIFGWSGIAATFCPVMILSLFWSGYSREGALASMVTGFLAVPVFKFAVPLIPVVGPYIGALEELTPAFLLAAVVGIGVSLVSPPTPEAVEAST